MKASILAFFFMKAYPPPVRGALNTLLFFLSSTRRIRFSYFKTKNLSVLPVHNIRVYLATMTKAFIRLVMVMVIMAGSIPLAMANDPCHCQGYAGVGGPCYDGPGGAAYSGVGGPAYAGVGGPCYDGVGGQQYAGVGGPQYEGIGGPAYAGVGGPAYDGVGGPAYAGVGGPCYAGVGGPCYAGVGGGDNCPDVCR